MEIKVESSLESDKQKKKYAVIPPSVRMAFIKRVLSKQATIKEASKEFGIKFSTSKAILQTYRKEGRVGKKKTRIRKSANTLEERQFTKVENKVEDVKEHGSVQQVKTDQKMSDFLSPQDFNLQMIQQQLQQQQLLQMQLMQNPYSAMLQMPNQQNLIEYYNIELERQKQINLQLWQELERQKNQKIPKQFGKIEEPEIQYLTPLQSMKCLDKSVSEGRSTFREL